MPAHDPRPAAALPAIGGDDRQLRIAWRAMVAAQVAAMAAGGGGGFGPRPAALAAPPRGVAR